MKKYKDKRAGQPRLRPRPEDGANSTGGGRALAALVDGVAGGENGDTPVNADPPPPPLAGIASGCGCAPWALLALVSDNDASGWPRLWWWWCCTVVGCGGG